MNVLHEFECVACMCVHDCHNGGIIYNGIWIVPLLFHSFFYFFWQDNERQHKFRTCCCFFPLHYLIPFICFLNQYFFFSRMLLHDAMPQTLENTIINKMKMCLKFIFVVNCVLVRQIESDFEATHLNFSIIHFTTFVKF